MYIPWTYVNMFMFYYELKVMKKKAVYATQPQTQCVQSVELFSSFDCEDASEQSSYFVVLTASYKVGIVLTLKPIF